MELNYMGINKKGKEVKESKCITTLEELKQAADGKKAVFVPSMHCWEKPKPAAFLLELKGVVLIDLFKEGMFVYEKKGGGEVPK